MRFLKADWVLPTIVFTPIVLLGGLLFAASRDWTRNTNRQQSLMAGLIHSEPVLKDISSDDAFQEIRETHEIMVSSTQLLDWQQLCLQDDEDSSLEWICDENVSADDLDGLQKLRAKSKVLRTLLRDRINSPSFSLSDFNSKAFSFSSFEYGSVNSDPIWLLEQVPYLDLQEAVVQENSDQVFLAMKDLIKLLVPGKGKVFSWDAMVYLPRALSNLRAVVASERLSDEQLVQLDQLLSVDIDWDAAWRQPKGERVWLAGQILSRPSVMKKSHQFVQFSYRDRKAMRDHNDYSLAPSETLAILEMFLGSTGKSQGSFHGIDRWLKPTRLASLCSPVVSRRPLDHFQTAVGIAKADMFFARAAIAIARLKRKVGEYPQSTSAFGKLGWSREEISEAEKQFEFGLSNTGVMITARNAGWYKDADGTLLDKGFSKQVRFDAAESSR